MNQIRPEEISALIKEQIKNYDQKIDSIIRASIFSSNPLSPKGVKKIENNNFS